MGGGAFGAKKGIESGYWVDFTERRRWKNWNNTQLMAPCQEIYSSSGKDKWGCRRKIWLMIGTKVDIRAGTGSRMSRDLDKKEKRNGNAFKIPCSIIHHAPK